MSMTEFDFYLIFAALIVLLYTFLGGLTSAIYNEVLQFFLIVIGFLPLVLIGLYHVGGWDGLVNNIRPELAHSWKYISPEHEMGGAIGIILGLGFVLSFGYWCTNFLVVQRAMAAGSMNAARRTPLIGAFPKMFIPFLVIVPGMIAIALLNMGDEAFSLPTKGAGYDYDMVIPMMLKRYLPTGVLGLGLTGLLASFMSGMAGNVTAFNTVFTYDIYQSYIVPGKSDNHYLNVGRFATIFGVLISILTAYVAALFNNVMDFLQLIFAFINAPLFAAFLMGMFTKRTTGHGAFWGLLSGTLAASLVHGLTQPAGAETLVKGGWLGTVVREFPSEMAQNFWIAIIAFSFALVMTIFISFATERTKTDEQLKGLVYQLTPRTVDDSKTKLGNPLVLSMIVAIIAIILSILFW
jgi:SSS family solute:Na+ symporter